MRPQARALARLRAGSTERVGTPNHARAGRPETEQIPHLDWLTRQNDEVTSAVTQARALSPANGWGLETGSAGSQLRLLVLATGTDEWAAVDMGSGAFVRARWPEAETLGLSAFDIVSAGRAADDGRWDDPVRPEAVVLDRPPTRVGSFGGRRARRYLRDLVLPDKAKRPLLGFRGPAAPYWTMTGTQPSMALIRPEAGPQVLLRQGDEAVMARFSWGGTVHLLEVEDARLVAAPATTGRSSLGGESLEAAVGFRTQYLVIAIGGPRTGHCYKAVIGALPQP